MQCICDQTTISNCAEGIKCSYAHNASRTYSNVGHNPEGLYSRRYVRIASKNVTNVPESTSATHICLYWGGAHSAPGLIMSRPLVSLFGGRGGTGQEDELVAKGWDLAVASTTASYPQCDLDSPTWGCMIHCWQNS